MNSENSAARLTGFMFLFVFVFAFGGMIAFDSLLGTNTISEILSSLSEQASRVRLSVLFLILASFGTIFLGVGLFLTLKRQNSTLALVALICRLVEAALYAVTLISILSLLDVSMDFASGEAEGTSLLVYLGGLLVNVKTWSSELGAIFFSFGSTLFCYLFIKSKTIPKFLSWLGLFASILVFLGLVLKVLNLVGAEMLMLVWLPMLVFEIGAGFWLLLKGADYSNLDALDSSFKTSNSS